MYRSLTIHHSIPKIMVHLTSQTPMGEVSVGYSDQMELNTFMKDECVDRQLVELCSNLAVTSKTDFPDKTVYEFLEEIAIWTNEMEDDLTHDIDPISMDSIRRRIYEDGGRLNIVDIMIQVFEMQHIVSYTLGMMSSEY